MLTIPVGKNKSIHCDLNGANKELDIKVKMRSVN